MVLQRLAGGLSRWLLVPALCATLAGCRTTMLVDSSAATALKVPNRAGELVIKTPEGHPLHIGKSSRLSFLLRDGSWTDPIEGRDLCVSEWALARCPGNDGPGLVLRWADVTGVEVDNFDGLKTFGAVVLVTALVAVVVVVVVLGARGGGFGGGGGGGGGHLGGGGGGGGGGGHLGGGGGGGGGHLGGGAGGGHFAGGGGHGLGWGHGASGSPARVDHVRVNVDGSQDQVDYDYERARVIPVYPWEETMPSVPVLPLFKRPVRRPVT
jgi:hypothetical protein